MANDDFDLNTISAKKEFRANSVPDDYGAKVAHYANHCYLADPSRSNIHRYELDRDTPLGVQSYVNAMSVGRTKFAAFDNYLIALESMSIPLNHQAYQATHSSSWRVETDETTMWRVSDGGWTFGKLLLSHVSPAFLGVNSGMITIVTSSPPNIVAKTYKAVRALVGHTNDSQPFCRSNDNTCVCVDGYEGESCEYKTCDSCTCGDAERNPGEECDDPDPAKCSTMCTLVEACDVSNTCTLANTFSVTNQPFCHTTGSTCYCASGYEGDDCEYKSCDSCTCGDGERNRGEICDDGNLHDGDGCTNTCTAASAEFCTQAGRIDCVSPQTVHTTAEYATTGFQTTHSQSMEMGPSITVASTETWLLVGKRLDQKVFFYTNGGPGTEWNTNPTLEVSGTSTGFGGLVELTDNYAVIGSLSTSDRRVFVYKNTNGDWGATSPVELDTSASTAGDGGKCGCGAIGDALQQIGADRAAAAGLERWPAVVMASQRTALAGAAQGPRTIPK
jgi:cysteine-rich repeat protein